MPKYNVRIYGSFQYDTTVEAANADEAAITADEVFAGNLNQIELYDYEHDVELMPDPHSPGSSQPSSA